jgi:hypothetical protein
MTLPNGIEHDVETLAGRLLSALPAHLQRPAWQTQLSVSTETGKGATPCIGKDCPPPPCKSLKCVDTIIGHDPLLLVVLVIVFAIGLAIGMLVGSRRSNR